MLYLLQQYQEFILTLPKKLFNKYLFICIDLFYLLGHFLAAAAISTGE